MSRTIDVKILGRSFRFDLPEEINPRTFMEIVQYVEDKVRSVRGQSIDLDSFRLGLLTSINIAEELFSVREENHGLREILRKIDGVLSSLDDEKENANKRGKSSVSPAMRTHPLGK